MIILRLKTRQSRTNKKELPHSLNIMYTKESDPYTRCLSCQKCAHRKGTPVLLWRLKDTRSRVLLFPVDGAELLISGPELADQLQKVAVPVLAQAFGPDISQLIFGLDMVDAGSAFPH